MAVYCHSAKCEVHPRDTVILIKTRARPVPAQGNPKGTVQAEGQSPSRCATGIPCSCWMADYISVQNSLNERQAYYLGQTDRTNDQMCGYGCTCTLSFSAFHS